MLAGRPGIVNIHGRFSNSVDCSFIQSWKRSALPPASKMFLRMGSVVLGTGGNLRVSVFLLFLALCNSKESPNPTVTAAAAVTTRSFLSPNNSDTDFMAEVTMNLSDLAIPTVATDGGRAQLQPNLELEIKFLDFSDSQQYELAKGSLKRVRICRN
ncbi:uncharacterized protein IUM83_11102 [Phytophthora cinnamomi]|uniref:uncharacterized protein n=1 Tax=Phytophthora cinnamomi TaxID=4785 RepID=UPI00355A7DEF|nr:hypothetical protein IUM83_11102 [Phytophthora cinnamomi]